MGRHTILLLGCAATLVACLAWPVARADRAQETSGLERLLRRPVALVTADDGKWLFVANQRSGTVSVIDTATAKTVGEVKVGARLADLAAMPDGSQLLAVDEEAGELVSLRRRGSELMIAHRVKVSPTPVAVRVSSDGRRAWVASLWSRRLSVVDLRPAPRVAHTIDLPFAPRRLLAVDRDRKIIVADSFGGQAGLIDAERGALESVRALPGHNIRGLVQSTDVQCLLVSYQGLNPLSTTSRDDIHWGNLITNSVRSLALARVLDPKADLLSGSEEHQLGEVGNGSGDPNGVAVGVGGRMVVALAGVNEVAVSGAATGEDWQHIGVGARPTAVLATADGRRAYVANTFADSVSVIDLKVGKAVATISLGPQAELKPSDRGELLFHDARLSHAGWMSCQSCHTDGHSNGRLADTLGDGTYGTPKRVPSLLGVKDTRPYAWNGSVPDLPSQVRKSVETTMRGKALSAEQVRDLTAYLETLSPPPARRKPDEAALKRGREVFTKHACASCHAPPAYTSAKSYDVGLADEAGLKTFNPPSLRGVGQGGPYFHDGRAATLTEVFARHRHQLKGELPKEDLADLVEFLGSL